VLERGGEGERPREKEKKGCYDVNLVYGIRLYVWLWQGERVRLTYMVGRDGNFRWCTRKSSGSGFTRWGKGKSVFQTKRT
jgi:hypothetical protein